MMPNCALSLVITRYQPPLQAVTGFRLLFGMFPLPLDSASLLSVASEAKCACSNVHLIAARRAYEC